MDTEGIADIYKVKFVPTMYLIDAQGVMVGENLRGEALANKLAELLERLNNHILLWHSDIGRGGVDE